MASPPLRIALISEHASPLALAGGVDAGGQNVYVAHVAAGMARLGHHVDVLTRRDQRQLATAVDMRPGVRVLHLEAGPPCFVPKERLLPHMKAFGTQALSLLRKSLPYDLVHANFFMSGLVGLRLQRSLGLPLVTTFHALGAVRRQHQAEADGFPPERVAIERRVAHLSDCVVAECPQDARDLMQLYELPQARIAQVPCGVDLAEFQPGDAGAARQRLGLDAGEFVVLQLGRLVPRKGIDNVIHALARLRAAGGVHRPVRLLVVGGESELPDEALTPEIGRLRRLAEALGVAARVCFVGRRHRAQLADYYRAADVFVTTPWYEPFGITPLESMACATPVVGSAVGGIQHTVVDGVTGYLVPPRDPVALAERLEMLRANPEQARALGRAGLARVQRLFTWDEVALRLEAVYQRAIAARAWAGAPARPAMTLVSPTSAVGPALQRPLAPVAGVAVAAAEGCRAATGGPA